ncbi:ABC-2 type transport system permease protein [Motilibacter peucedani]|uniref:ABC-2 type transport system permease protein n=1 Tax=Motilibacter peucedani TaxID=598650 RepID=A0A420XTU1_9ACTN|nr:ABC-2 family transporter protein [Motilibacter peucedani]RKS80266.1 ABC-2 type transport system permease protein [Motilibacter peucedani]
MIPGALPALRRGAPLVAYRALARAALRSLLAYQVTFLFGVLASVFSALAMLYLWHAVLGSSATSQGFDWPHMKAYLLVAFAAGSLPSSWVDYRMAFRIQRGEVALDLVRPVDYQAARFAEAVGFAVYELGTALVVVAVAAVAFGGIPGPPLGTLPLLVLSVLLVLPLRFGIVYASAMAVFWTQNYVGVQAGRVALVSLFSGALVPLAFLPHWLHVLAAALPFAGMASTPALLFAGELDGRAAVVAVAVQAAWTVALWLGTRALWSAASRQLTVHGG